MGNYNQLQRLTFDTERTLAFGSISGTYAKVGTSLGVIGNIFFVFNFTDVALQFSFDGVNNAFVLGTLGSIQIDAKNNNLFLPIGTQLYVKNLTTGPSSGAVYFSVVYAGGVSS